MSHPMNIMVQALYGHCAFGTMVGVCYGDIFQMSDFHYSDLAKT